MDKICDERKEIEKFIKGYLCNLWDQYDYKSYWEKNKEKCMPNDKIRTIFLHDKHELIVIKNKQQHGGALCGFHCIFSLLNFFKMMSKPAKKDYYLHKMNSDVQFSKFYIRILNILINKMGQDHSEVESLKKGGALERYQFMLLIKNAEIFNKILNPADYQVEFFSFFYAFDYLQGLSKSEMIKFQGGINKLRARTSGRVFHVYLLGVTNHWSILILEKRDTTYNFYYIDCSNINMFNLVDKGSSSGINTHNLLVLKKEELQKIEEFANSHIQQCDKYRKVTPWFRKCFIQWVGDINKTLDFFFNFIYEDFNIYDIYMDCNVRLLIESFETLISGDLEKVDFASWIKEKDRPVVTEKLLFWLKVEYHPKIIYEDICMSIEMFQYVLRRLPMYGKFVKWLDFSRNLKSVLTSEDGIPDEERGLLERYYQILDYLEKYQ